MSIPSRQNRKQVFQFARAETWAIKPKKGKGPKQWGIADVFAEALRVPENSTHVLKPIPPRHIAGMTREEMLAGHDNICRETVKSGGRKARPDVHTLVGAVYSWPYKPEETDAELYSEWVKRSLAFHEAEFGVVHAAFEHSDESFPHLHVYTINNDAKNLHAGSRAKRQALEAKPHQAYRDAMLGWQDRFYEIAGQPCGLLRLGPRRRRLEQPAVKTERYAAIATAKAQLRREQEIEAAVHAAAEKVIRPAAIEAEKALVAAQTLYDSGNAALAAAAQDKLALNPIIEQIEIRERELDARDSDFKALGQLVAGIETPQRTKQRHDAHRALKQVTVEQGLASDGVKPAMAGYLRLLKERIGEWWDGFLMDYGLNDRPEGPRTP